MAKSTRKRRANKASKPAKPYPDFPLFPHDSGRWAKKIRGKLHYFGRWGRKQGDAIVWVDEPDAGAQAAVDLYNAQRDDLYAGRTPRDSDPDTLTVAELCAEFLESKSRRVKTGELKQRTFAEYHETCRRILAGLGARRPVEDLRPKDFEALRGTLTEGARGRRGLAALGKDIRIARMVFKYGVDADLIDRPVKFGPEFHQPKRKHIRAARQKNGKRMIEAGELQQILALLDGEQVALDRIDGETGEPIRVRQKRNPILRAMVLLGINGGLGQHDIACLPKSAVDWENGIIDFPRPKTAVERRIPLWPETLAALKDAVELRPPASDPKDDGLCFLTKGGNRYVREKTNGKPENTAWIDAIGMEFGKVLRKLDLKRPGLNFYALRHTFRTIADRSKDGPAIDHVMGHSRDDMASHYREEIANDRLRAVVNVVHAWLFAMSVSLV